LAAGLIRHGDSRLERQQLIQILTGTGASRADDWRAVGVAEHVETGAIENTDAIRVGSRTFGDIQSRMGPRLMPRRHAARFRRRDEEHAAISQ
jgi:hypothetical protein